MQRGPSSNWAKLPLQDVVSALETRRTGSLSEQDILQILYRCRKEKNQAQAKRVYSYLHSQNLDNHSVFGNCLVFTLVEVGCLGHAQTVFDSLGFPSQSSWNSIISGYVKSRNFGVAISVYHKMRDANNMDSPSVPAFLSLIRACSTLSDITTGVIIHSHVSQLKLLQSQPFIGCALVDMYAKCGSIEKAKKLFDELAFRDEASWNALVTGYANSGCGYEALSCFDQMQLEGILPNNVTFICALKACGSTGYTAKGCEVHASINVGNLVSNYLFVGTALVDMYAKCGLLVKAQDVFDSLPDRNVVCWTALISGYAHHGYGKKALWTFDLMQDEGILPNVVTFISSLRACTSIHDSKNGMEIHSEIIRRDFLDSNILLGNTLIDMYSKCGMVSIAHEVFESLPIPDVVSWNALMMGYFEQGHSDEVLKCFENMQDGAVPIDSCTYVCILKACGSVGAIERGREIHADIQRRGMLEIDFMIGNSLVDLYANFGMLLEAHLMFEKLPVHDIVSWNTLMSGYVEYGYAKEAISCFEQMLVKGISADSFTYVCVIKACGDVKDKERGQKLHAEIECRGFLEEDLVTGNSLVDFYVKCGLHELAQLIFDRLPARSVITWNTLISGYVSHGQFEKGLETFSEMQKQGIPPDTVTFAATLKACSIIRAKDLGQEIHAELERKEVFERDPTIGNTLLDMYGKCGLLAKAMEVFDRLPARDIISWNAMIGAYTVDGDKEQTLKYFYQMQSEFISPDEVTFMNVLKSTCCTGEKESCKELHSAIVRLGYLENNLPLASTLVSTYAELGFLAEAQYVLDCIPERDVVPWNALISGYVEHDCNKVALKCFEHVQHDGVFPDAVTFSLALKACMNLGALEKGLELHLDIAKLGLMDTHAVVGNTLVDMYSKFGLTSLAQKVFNEIPVRDIGSWNSLIAGYDLLGDSGHVFCFFREMLEEGVKPDTVTFIILLKACSREGLCMKGAEFLDAMSEEYGIKPTLDHHTCVIDLLGRVGQLEELREIIKELPCTPDIAMWHAVLGACGKLGNVALGKEAFDHAVCLDEKDAATYALMSGIYSLANI